MRQAMMPLPPPLPPGHGAPTVLIDSMQWGPGRAMRPPPHVGNSQPLMAPFDGGRGFGKEVMAAGRHRNIIVVPTRREEQLTAGLFASSEPIKKTHQHVFFDIQSTKPDRL